MKLELDISEDDYNLIKRCKDKGAFYITDDEFGMLGDILLSGVKNE